MMGKAGAPTPRPPVMTFSLFTLLAGSLLCGWAVLRCLGNERERQVRELERRLAVERSAADRDAADPVPLAKSPPPAKLAR